MTIVKLGIISPKIGVAGRRSGLLLGTFSRLSLLDLGDVYDGVYPP